MIKVCAWCSNDFDGATFYDGRKRTHGLQRRFCTIKCQEKYTYSTPRQREVQLKREYGLTMQEYNALLEKQSGLCALCKSAETTVRKTGSKAALSVDHDHNTGKVRGLLCTPCNRGIGFLRDSIDLLEAAVVYLKVSEGDVLEGIKDLKERAWGHVESSKISFDDLIALVNLPGRVKDVRVDKRNREVHVIYKPNGKF